jgi:hypothetical protein
VDQRIKRALWRPGVTGMLVPPGFVPQKPITSSIIYQERHPTRYEWHPEVRTVIRRVYRKFGGPSAIHINTYVCHPEDWCWDTVSFDVWGPLGRNDPIGFDLGQRVFDFVYDMPGDPYIEWCIWRRTIRSRINRYMPYPFGQNEFEYHDDHPHFSFNLPHRVLR